MHGVAGWFGFLEADQVGYLHQHILPANLLWNPFNRRTIPMQGKVMHTTESDLGKTESQPPSTDGVYLLQQK
jgi:hypothetical protein